MTSIIVPARQLFIVVRSKLSLPSFLFHQLDWMLPKLYKNSSPWISAEVYQHNPKDFLHISILLPIDYMDFRNKPIFVLRSTDMNLLEGFSWKNTRSSIHNIILYHVIQWKLCLSRFFFGKIICCLFFWIHFGMELVPNNPDINFFKWLFRIMDAIE